MNLTCLSGEDLRAALPMDVAVRVMKQAFAAFSAGRADTPLRTVLSIPEVEGSTLVMPCYLPDYGLGTKLVSIFPGNRGRFKPAIQGVVILLNPATGEPNALIDGTALTAWRTGAASGAALRRARFRTWSSPGTEDRIAIWSVSTGTPAVSALRIQSAASRHEQQRSKLSMSPRSGGPPAVLPSAARSLKTSSMFGRAWMAACRSSGSLSPRWNTETLT